MTGDARVRLKHHELHVLRSALRQREAAWRAERSRAQRAGASDRAAAADAVLRMFGDIAGKLDQACERAGEPTELIS